MWYSGWDHGTERGPKWKNQWNLNKVYSLINSSVPVLVSDCDKGTTVMSDVGGNWHSMNGELFGKPKIISKWRFFLKWFHLENVINVIIMCTDSQNHNHETRQRRWGSCHPCPALSGSYLSQQHKFFFKQNSWIRSLQCHARPWHSWSYFWGSILKDTSREITEKVLPAKFIWG